MHARWNWIAILALAGCAKTPRVEVGAVPDAVRAWQDKVDWEAAGDETVAVLSDYLAVDTVNPEGNESRGARYLQQVLAREGIPSEIYESAPGRGNLVARLDSPVDSAGPICLVSHIDVVTSEPEHWDEAPLSGVVKDGWVWGRGALDMKGMGAIELMAMILLHRQQVPLSRDIVLLAVADEEVRNTGIQYMVDHHWDALGCTNAINEGGVGLPDVLFDDQVLMPISVGEKGALWVEVLVSGEPGHGSTPIADRAPERLLRTAHAFEARQAREDIPQALYEMLANVGAHQGGFSGFVLQRASLVDMLVTGKLRDNPATHAAMTNTLNITGFEGRNEPNVVPGQVKLVLDCRLLPGTTADDMLAELQALVGDPDYLQWNVIQAFEGNISPWDDDFYRAIARNIVDGRPEAVAGPFVSIGFTDSIYLRPKGVNAYGYVPFIIDEEGLRSMHGHNERVSVDNVHDGVRTLFSILVDAAAVR